MILNKCSYNRKVIVIRKEITITLCQVTFTIIQYRQSYKLVSNTRKIPANQWELCEIVHISPSDSRKDRQQHKIIRYVNIIKCGLLWGESTLYGRKRLKIKKPIGKARPKKSQKKIKKGVDRVTLLWYHVSR